MNPDQTFTISLEYLVEFSDDGKQPDQPEPEVILIPPASNGADPSSAPPSVPKQEPRL